MFELIHGDCLEILKTLQPESVDAIVTDPPYGLSFMGKRWDYDVPTVEVWQECLRVLKPGGHLLSFAGTRTQHRMAVRIEDAGFEIRDVIAWVYGCLDAKTKVVTSEGVKRHTETKVGDTVLCYDPSNGEYSYQPILEIVEYEYSDTAYRLISNAGVQVVSKNHRVIVEQNGKEAFALAETLSGRQQVRIPILSELPDPRSQRIREWRGHRTAIARVVPFHYTGKVWCLRVPTGAFVAVRHGVAFPTGNSGFPKSHDVSKAIDREAGAIREVTGMKADADGRERWKEQSQGKSSGFSGNLNVSRAIDAPATPEAQQWDGWGSALKPSFEPITVARKPLIGTIAQNVLRYGTGGINIDGCRIGDGDDRTSGGGVGLPKNSNVYGRGGITAERPTNGRFPANFIHDGSDEVLDLFPYQKSGGKKPHINNSIASKNVTSLNHSRIGKMCNYTADPSEGSAARFFYCAKATRQDRDEGLNGKRSMHPTVKPTALMQYLCRLITPPNGLILDPFTGSGSTGKAAILEGFRFLGIEQDREYCDIATARIAHAAATREDRERRDSAQLPLF